MVTILILFTPHGLHNQVWVRYPLRLRFLQSNRQDLALLSATVESQFSAPTFSPSVYLFINAFSSWKAVSTLRQPVFDLSCSRVHSSVSRVHHVDSTVALCFQCGALHVATLHPSRSDYSHAHVLSRDRREVGASDVLVVTYHANSKFGCGDDVAISYYAPVVGLG